VAFLSAAGSKRVAQSTRHVAASGQRLTTASAGFNIDQLLDIDTKILSSFLSTLTPLMSMHPSLFAPHLQSLLSFLSAPTEYSAQVSGWTAINVRAYLEGMGDFDDAETSGLEVWW
jgi:hypothetical protein